MRRREFTAGVAAMLAVPSIAHAQRVRARMGWLSGGSVGLAGNPLDVLKQSLADLGWRTGDTLQIDERHAGGAAMILPRLAGELAALKPDVIGATGGTEAKALQEATRDIPIVFMQVAVDPVAAGIVRSITRPVGNLTGFTQSPEMLWGKRLDIIRELLARRPLRIGFLGNPQNVTFGPAWSNVTSEVGKIGATVARGDLSGPEELGRAFHNFEGCDALLVQFDFMTVRIRDEIARLAAERRLPAVYEQRRHILSGGLLSYGPDLTENYRQGAIYINRVLRGIPVSELPVVQGSRFEMVINLRTAAALGLTLSPTLLARADEVIE
jgi:putative tryptophan/tyrosine transport system substrate-binding protein